MNSIVEEAIRRLAMSLDSIQIHDLAIILEDKIPVDFQERLDMMELVALKVRRVD
jgi:hypothetical protein